MNSRKDLIKYISHLLKTNKTLPPEIRQALKMAIKELQQPEAVNIDQVLKITEILLTGLSVGMELYKHFQI